MDKEDVVGFVKKALPWIGAAATGNVPVLVGLASKAVGDALGTEVEATPEAITAAVEGATPEQVIALRKADNDFATKMREYGYKELTEMYATEVADRNAARERDVKLKMAGYKNRRADVMLALTFAGIVALVGVMLWKEIDANTAIGGVILLLVGKFIGQWETAFMFEFGSTRSNKDKDETIKVLSGGKTSS